MRYPIKLNDDYPCQGTDADGETISFNDLLTEGQRVGPWAEEGGEAEYVTGVVVRREDGLCAVATTGWEKGS